MKNIWFTSDLHYGHSNIAGPQISRWKSGYRNFNTVHDMNNTLANTINKYVEEDDILYFLGDLCFGNHKRTPLYRESINCKNIHFIRGNHDNHIDKYKNHFLSINDTLSINHGGVKIFLSHYAHRVWFGSHRGIIHLYGHSHGTVEDYGKSMDVGVDVAYKMFGEYRPFSLSEVVDIMSTRK